MSSDLLKLHSWSFIWPYYYIVFHSVSFTRTSLVYFRTPALPSHRSLTSNPKLESSLNIYPSNWATKTLHQGFLLRYIPNQSSLMMNAIAYAQWVSLQSYIRLVNPCDKSNLRLDEEEEMIFYTQGTLLNSHFIYFKDT